MRLFFCTTVGLHDSGAHSDPVLFWKMEHSGGTVPEEYRKV